MLKVSHLVKFVHELKPQSTPTRLTFFNYISNLCDPEASLTAELVDQFFLSALDYAHWYSHRTQLGHEVELLLENFNSYFQNQFPIHLVRFPQTIQIVDVEQTQDWQEVVSEFLRRHCGPHDRFRLLSEPTKRGVGLILRQDGTLDVRFFDRKMTLRQGLLEPLRRDLIISYDSNLELASNHFHKFDLAPQMTAQFKSTGDLVTGTIVRGYFFQKMQSFELTHICEIPKLFSQLKRVETLFVQPQSDSYYLDLKSQLEKTISLLAVGDSEAKEWASYLHAQAEIASKEIYSDDKTLESLVKELSRLLKKESPGHDKKQEFAVSRKNSPQQVHVR